MIKYDATAPAVTLLAPKAGKRRVELIWRTTPDAQTVGAAPLAGRQR